jgi:DNA polymerase III delta subunit
MAVPNPEQELRRLEQQCARGLQPVTWIGGPSDYFRDEAMARAVAAVPSERNLRTIDGAQATDGREVQDLRGGALFGGGTWLAVRRAETWLKDHHDAVMAVLPRIGGGCGLVLEAGKVDGRTKLGRALAATDSYQFRDLYAEPYDRSRSPLEAELVQWVVQRGRKGGVALSPEAALLVVAVVGKNPAELVQELGRLAVSLPAGRTLRPEDVQGRLTSSFGSNPFELAEALLDFDRRRCERSLAAMFARGVKGRDGRDTADAAGVFVFTASWLHQALAAAHAGRLLLDAGVPAHEVAARVGVRAFADRFQRQVARNPAARLAVGLDLLQKCQRDLRLTGEEPRWLLERFLAAYFRAAAPAVAAPPRGRGAAP